jgi:hypothetical protein
MNTYHYRLYTITATRPASSVAVYRLRWAVYSPEGKVVAYPGSLTAARKWIDARLDA